MVSSSGPIQHDISLRDVMKIWLPLVFMWLIMGVEQPVIAAVIARMPHPETNLAVFGIAFSLALVIESPIIQLLAAGTALSGTKQGYRRILSFTHLLSIILTVIHASIALTPLYSLLMRHIIQIPEELIEPSRRAFLVLLPWSASIAYRRLWQGVLIKHKKTGYIPATMIIRLGATSLVLAAGFFMKGIAGSSIGALSLTAGVAGGAVSAGLFSRKTVKHIPVSEETEKGEISWRYLFRFYTPLALTSFIVLSARPILTFGIAQAPEPISSLAVWPVITAFLFLFHSVALSYQELVIALLKNRQGYGILKKFRNYLSLGLGALYLLAVLTPFRRFWFTGVSGLSEHLYGFVTIPVIILIPFASIFSFISWYRGLHVWMDRTIEITRAILVNIVILLGLMFTGAFLVPVPGAITATAAYVLSVAGEALYFYLRKPENKIMQKLN
jgi:hypothetical protein